MGPIYVNRLSNQTKFKLGGENMPKHKNVEWASNYAKYMAKRAKSDFDKRRWYAEFIRLNELGESLVLVDTLPPETEVKSIDEKTADTIRRIKLGGA
jgi:hypothetical protein